MKLYIFDYCPYCQIANMVAKYKGLKVENVILQNHDIASRERMANSSTVPILEKPDGTYMAESSDIAHFLDRLSDKRIILPASKEQEIHEWMDKALFYIHRLTFPRTVKIGLPELQSPEAIEWFTKNKEAMIGMSFDEAMAHDEEWRKEMEKLLAELSFMQLPSTFDNQLSWDDIQLFPFLRNLTMVKDLAFPKPLMNYLNEIASLCNINLYLHRAV